MIFLKKCLLFKSRLHLHRIYASSLFLCHWQSVNSQKKKLFPALSGSCLVAYFQTEVKGGQIGLIQQSLVPFSLIVIPFSNGFRRRTLCPSEEFNKLSDCLNSGGVIHPLCELWANTETQWEFFTLSILPLPVKQTFEGFCVACLYFTISKRCLLTGDLNYNHLDIRQASAWNNAARLLRTEHQ